ncbi:DUF6924 domain-containing protein [Catenulispora subtropica]|uniref:Uncharacterized protein n=1 Tax=Catenulispora subtropica TaxID=450798 RepID=A0ABP5BTU8_9ACTN
MERPGDTRAIRVWLRQNGVEISDRGRIPSDLMEKYERAHGIEPIPDDLGRALPLLPHHRDGALVVRTDFRDDEAWRAVVATAGAPTRDGFQAYVLTCEDRAFAGLTPGRLMAHLPTRHRHRVLFVADAMTMENPEHPLIALSVDEYESPGDVLRAVPSAVQAISDNLDIANMRFHDFVLQADPDGVLRLY